MSYLDFDFPHSHMYDDDLKEIIAIVVKLSKTMAEFINMNVITFSEPINWDITKQYSKSVIVIDELGNAYLSKQEVPKGIELDNEDYWLEIFNFTDYVTKANSNLTFNTETAERSTHSYETDDWLLWNDLLYKVTSNIAVNDRLVIGTNITRFTVEEFCRVWAEYTVTKIQQYKNEIDASEREYKTQIDASELAYKNELERLFNDAISGVTVDSEVISARTGTDKIPYSVLKDAINDQIHGILFSNEFKTMYPVWNRKTLDSNLSIIDANNRCLTDAFTAGTVRVKFDSSMFIVVVRCDSEGNPTAKSENITTSPFLCSSTEKMRILTGKLDNTSINAATAASLVRISTSQMADEYYRQQDKDLNSIRYNYIPQWTREAYDNNNEVVSSTNRCLSSIIYATSVLINVEEGFEYIPVWLNSNGNVIGREQDWQPSGEVLLKGISNRLRICIRYSNNASMAAYIPLGAITIKTIQSFENASINGIDTINSLNLVDPLLSFEGGAIGNNGVPTNPVNTRARTDYIKTDYLKIELLDSNYYYQYVVYDESDNMVYKTPNWLTDPSIFKLHGYKTRIVVSKNDNSNLNPAEAKNALSIMCAIDKNYYPEYDTSGNQTLLDSGEVLEHVNISQLKNGTSYYNNVPFAAFTKNGVLIVGADLRMGTGLDTEPTEVFVTRSTDGGQTFEAATKLFAKGNNATNSRVNDCTILATKSGRVFVFAHWCDSDVSWQNMSSDDYNADRADFDLRYKYSDDDGVTWSNEISLQSLYFSNSDIMTILGGLASGIETESGMLILPISCKMKSNNTDMSGDMFRYQCTILYSTNGGTTWQMHTALTPNNTLEPNVIEYAPNKFIMCCRGYISARRFYTFEYEPDNGTFTEYKLAKADCVIKEPSGHAASFYKFQYGYRTVGLYGGSLALGSDRGKSSVVATKDYCHFKPVIPVRNVEDNRYGMICFASYKGHLVAVYSSNNGRIFISNLDKYIELIMSI